MEALHIRHPLLCVLRTWHFQRFIHFFLRLDLKKSEPPSSEPVARVEFNVPKVKVFTVVNACSLQRWNFRVLSLLRVWAWAWMSVWMNETQVVSLEEKWNYDGLRKNRRGTQVFNTVFIYPSLLKSYILQNCHRNQL